MQSREDSEKKQEILLETMDISKFFPVKKRRLQAVKNVSFTLDRGECLGIVGESGCGKSTLARIIGGITEASQGRLVLEGIDYTRLKGREKRKFHRNIQMVFQDPISSFSPRMKIGTYLAEALRNYNGISRKEGKKEAEKLLEQVGLPKEFAKRYPHELSGGQLQRAAIARAISIRPKLLICDEATGALDVSIQNQIARLLVRLVEEQHMACIFIGHDLALVRSVSQRIAVMYLGRIVEVLESEHLVSQARHPYTKALLSAVLDVYRDQNQEPVTLKGEPQSPLKDYEGCAFAERCDRCVERCRKKVPALRQDFEGHQIACHNPVF